MPIITNVKQIPNLIIDKKYETKKSIKFNICNGDKKILYISPDFSNISADRGMPCGKYVKGSLPLFLDNNNDGEFIGLIDAITDRVNQALNTSGYDKIPDKNRPISRWEDKNKVMRISMWCDIIHSDNKGVQYTKIYDTTGKTVNVTDITTIAYVRPCICFRLSYSFDDGVFRLRASISEMCIINIGVSNKLKMLPNA